MSNSESIEIMIVPFEPQYQIGVIQLILPIQQEEFGISITLEQQSDLEDIPNFYQSRKGNFWVALHDNQVVGSLGLLDIGEDNGALRKMFVHPEYRGPQAGIAKKLLETLMVWAQQRGYANIYLGTTDQFHAAHRFYTKNHFVCVEPADLPSTFPIMKVDTIFFHYAMSDTSGASV